MKSDLEFWIEAKEAYERNLKQNIGHKKSIQQILEKINVKICHLKNIQ